MSKARFFRGGGSAQLGDAARFETESIGGGSLAPTHPTMSRIQCCLGTARPREQVAHGRARDSERVSAPWPPLAAAMALVLLATLPARIRQRTDKRDRGKRQWIQCHVYAPDMQEFIRESQAAEAIQALPARSIIAVAKVQPAFLYSVLKQLSGVERAQTRHWQSIVDSPLWFFTLLHVARLEHRPPARDFTLQSDRSAVWGTVDVSSWRAACDLVARPWPSWLCFVPAMRPDDSRSLPGPPLRPCMAICIFLFI